MPHAVETRLGESAGVIDDLARFGEVLAVVAHPDDESFGLGAVLAAAQVLGVTRARLADYRDDVPPGLLDAEIETDLGDAALLVVFEPGGVTGHPDHRAATAADFLTCARPDSRGRCFSYDTDRPRRRGQPGDPVPRG